MMQKQLQTLSEQDLQREEQNLQKILNLDQLKILIEQGLKTKQEIQNKDIIILIGKTGSGKSTFTNLLLNKKIIVDNVQIKDENGEIKTFENVYRVIDPIEGSKVGYRMVSETSYINRVLLEEGLFLCDFPGLNDSRGLEFELSISKCITDVLKEARSVRIVLLISYYSLKEGRGDNFKDILENISQYINQIETYCYNMRFFYSHCQNNSLNDVKQILQNMNSDPMTPFNQKIILQSMMMNIGNQMSFIVDPIKDSQTEKVKTYIDLIKNIDPINQQVLQNLFKYSLSINAKDKLKNYAYELSKLIQKYQQIKNYQKITNLLNGFRYLADEFKDLEFLSQKYNECVINIQQEFDNYFQIFFDQILNLIDEEKEIGGELKLRFDEQMIQLENWISNNLQTKFSKSQVQQEFFQRYQRLIKKQIQSFEGQKGIEKLEKIQNQITQLGLSEETKGQIIDIIKPIIESYHKQLVDENDDLIQEFFDSSTKLKDKSEKLQNILKNLKFLKLIDEKYTSFVKDSHQDQYKFFEVIKEHQKCLVKYISELEKSINISLQCKHDFEDSNKYEEEKNYLNWVHCFEKLSESESPDLKLLIQDYLHKKVQVKESLELAFEQLQNQLNEEKWYQNLKNWEPILCIIKTLLKLGDLKKQLSNNEKKFETSFHLQFFNFSQLIQEFSNCYICTIQQGQNLQKQRQMFQELKQQIIAFESLPWIEKHFHVKINTQNKLIQKKIVKQIESLHGQFNISIESNDYNWKNIVHQFLLLNQFIQLDKNDEIKKESSEKFNHAIQYLENQLNKSLEEIKKFQKYSCFKDFSQLIGQINEIVQFRKELDHHVKISDLDKIKENAIKEFKDLYEEKYNFITQKTKDQIFNDLEIANYKEWKTIYIIFQLLSTNLQIMNLISVDEVDQATDDDFRKDQQIKDYICQVWVWLIEKFKSLNKTNVQESLKYRDFIRKFYNLFQKQFSNFQEDMHLLGDEIILQNTFQDIDNLVKEQKWKSLNQKYDQAKNIWICEQIQEHIQEKVEQVLKEFNDIIKSVSIKTDLNFDSSHKEKIKKGLKLVKELYPELLHQDYFKNQDLLNIITEWFSYYTREMERDFIQSKIQAVIQLFDRYIIVSNIIIQECNDNQNIIKFMEDSSIQLKEKAINFTKIYDIEQIILKNQVGKIQELFEFLDQNLKGDDYSHEIILFLQDQKSNFLKKIQFRLQQLKENHDQLAKNHIFERESILKEITNIVEKLGKWLDNEEINIQQLKDGVKEIEKDLYNKILKIFQEKLESRIDKYMELRENLNLVNKNSQEFQKFMTDFQKKFSEFLNKIKNINQSLKQSEIYELILRFQCLSEFVEILDCDVDFNNFYPEIGALQLEFIHQIKNQIYSLDDKVISDFLIFELIREKISSYLNDDTSLALSKESNEIIDFLNLKLDEVISLSNNINSIHEKINLKQNLYQLQLIVNQFIKSFEANKKTELQQLYTKMKDNLNIFDIMDNLNKEIYQTIQDVEKELLQYINSQEYDKLVQKWVETDKIKSKDFENKKNNLKDQFISKVNSQKTSIQSFLQNQLNIQEEECEQNLKNLFEHEKDIKQIDLLFSEFNPIYQQVLINIRQYIKAIKDNILNQNSEIKDKALLLIKIFTIRHLVPNLQNEVNQVIDDILNEILKYGDHSLREIYDFYRNEQDRLMQIKQLNEIQDQYRKKIELGIEITDNFSQFQEQQIKQINEITQKSHNPEYVAQKITRIGSNNIIQNLFQEQQQLLIQQYEKYQQIYFLLIKQYYRKQISKQIIIQQILDSRTFLLLDAWDQTKKQYSLQIFAYISVLYIILKTEKHSKSPCLRLHATQVFSILLLLQYQQDPNLFERGANQAGIYNISLQNTILQILTGEGKSIVLGILAAIFAIIGHSVDVCCYSQYLSKRDYEDFEKLYQVLQIDKIIQYGTFSQLAENYMETQGQIRENIQKLIQKQQTSSLQQPQSIQRILLLDEVDKIIEFYGQTYNPALLLRNDDIEVLMMQIYEIREKEVENIIDETKESEIYKKIISENQEFKLLFESQVRKMAYAARQTDDHKYEIKNDKIGYLQHNDIITDISYGYLTAFAYLKEYQKQKITLESFQKQFGLQIQCGFYSYLDIIQQYKLILGVSGTVKDLHPSTIQLLSEFIKNFYIIPSMFSKKNNLRFEIKDDFIITKDKMDQFTNISNNISIFQQKRLPVIVVLRNQEILNELDKELKRRQFKKINIIDQFQDINKLNENIRLATFENQITLMAREFGRGTDFQRSSKEINQNGGLVVIQTFFSEDKSEELQIKGRTARQDQKGIYQQIFCEINLMEDFLIKKEDFEQSLNNKEKLFNILENARIKQFESVIQLMKNTQKSAITKHQKTIQFQNYIKQQHIQKSIECLIEFNNEIEGSDQQYDFFLICDDSGSMYSDWKALKDAINIFLQERMKFTEKNKNKKDLISVIYYSTQSRIIANRQNIQEVQNIINTVQPAFNQTNFINSIKSLQEILNEENEQSKQLKKFVLFMTDGEDQGDRTQLISEIQNLKNKFGNQIIGWWNIAFGPKAQVDLLEVMSKELENQGGKVKRASNSDELKNEFKQFAMIQAIFAK